MTKDQEKKCLFTFPDLQSELDLLIKRRILHFLYKQQALEITINSYLQDSFFLSYLHS